MLKRIHLCFLFALSVLGVLVSCSRDADFEGRISKLEERVSRLEQLCGISGPVTITVRVMDTHAHIVPDVSLTIAVHD